MTELEALRLECLECKKCAIGGVKVDGEHLSNVFSNMNTSARVMVVGQNPGRDEVERGEPFVGASGRAFDRAVEERLGMSRSDFYISNVVRCYTEGNRGPYQEEIDACRAFLDREVELVKPEIIISLGAPAFKQLTGMGGITKHHGELRFSPRYGVNVMPLFHPSPLNLNDPSRREMFYDGLDKLKRFLDERDSPTE